MAETKQPTPEKAAPPSDKKADKNAAKPRGGKWRTVAITVLAVPTILLAGLPTLLLCVGMLPTLVALVTDTDPRKSGAATIGFMNLAGVAPFIIDLWGSGQTMGNAIAILSTPSTWLVMFGAAGVGHLLLYAIPTATATLTLTRMESRLKILKEAIEQMKTTWGPDIATNKSLEDVRKKNGA